MQFSEPGDEQFRTQFGDKKFQERQAGPMGLKADLSSSETSTDAFEYHEGQGETNGERSSGTVADSQFTKKEVIAIFMGAIDEIFGE